MPVHDLNSFEDLRGPNLCIIDFYATWCQPCHSFKPFYNLMSETHKHSKFFQVDVDNENLEEIVKYFEISAMPTFIFVRNGNVVAKVMGADQQQFQATLYSLLQ
jgi:thioredoxin 1